MPNKTTFAIAFLLIAIMFVISVTTIFSDALTFDELAHIPAGYSYLKYQDYRINPEHPPLTKSLSATPLIYKDLNFPLESQNWLQEDAPPAWWVQFDLGTEFIYRSGNNPREIIFWSRFPMILMTMLLALFVFKWARELSGNKVALVALALFSFSPTLIAHGRLVTTDVGAALGTVIGLYYWIRFLKLPDYKNAIIAGVAFGTAMLFKFSMALLIPTLVIITITYVATSLQKDKLKSLFKYSSLSLMAAIIGVIFVIWPVYAYHIQNYPAEQQLRDTSADLEPNPIKPLRDLTISFSDHSTFRPLAQYARGLLMATQRTGFGNTVYFLGEISAKGWWYYFPVIYLFKEPLPLHILTALVIMGGFYFMVKKRKRLLPLSKGISRLIRNNFTIFSFLIFIGIYWAAAIQGNLNIGVRHLIPTLPLFYIILAVFIKKIYRRMETDQSKKMIIGLSSLCIGWYGISSLLSFPNYIPYYNSLGGGTEYGYLSAVDSNYDWGQDFYKLVEFVEENEIDQIHLDYFGGEDPNYWLGDKYLRLNPREVTELPQGWVAISVNQLMGGVAIPVPEFDQETGFYDWLSEYEFKGRIGKSIFIYHSI